MSLVVMAVDSVQAIAISDGRAFTNFRGELKFLRDDASKVLQLSPQFCVAATNQGCWYLFRAVADYFASRPVLAGPFDDPFQDLVDFAWKWLDSRVPQLNMRVAFCGWSNALKRMRVVTGNWPGKRYEFTEHFPLGEGKPVFLAMGKVDASVLVSAEKLVVDDPMPVLREAFNRKISQDPETGGKAFEYLLQGPEFFLTRPDPWRVWPIMEPNRFVEALKANPPASLDEFETHFRVRALIESARLGIPLEALVVTP